MSSLVFPFHDPKNIETPFLKKITPIIKKNFDHAFVSLTPSTLTLNPQISTWLKADSFFITNDNISASLPGDHFLTAFANAVSQTPSDYLLHLCNSDRLAFAVLNYPDQFLSDLKQAEAHHQAAVFTRSSTAWSTHPNNYYAAESLVSGFGQLLFNQSLDFAWCHLMLTSSQLKSILPLIKNHDMSLFVELVFHLRDSLVQIPVDWLSWEDPFILGKDPATYKTEREHDPVEIKKRLAYVIPMINFLCDQYLKLNQ